MLPVWAQALIAWAVATTLIMIGWALLMHWLNERDRTGQHVPPVDRTQPGERSLPVQVTDTREDHRGNRKSANAPRYPTCIARQHHR